LNALFYKAGKVPWRLPREEGDFKASYLGIGFYRDLSGQRLLTSTAQMFDERGRGLSLRGARAQTDKGDLHPYLERNDAYDLVMRSVPAYRAHHGHAPARLVILKTARFQPGEADGIGQACDEMQIDRRDLVWVSESSHVTLVRESDHPPLRGSFIQLGRDALLFTRGSVPYYRHLSRPSGSPADIASPARLRQLAPRDRGGGVGAHEDELEHHAIRPGPADPDPRRPAGRPRP
jgi:hypothetical protein